jgi:Calcineurin-like phosphoesterase
LQLFLRLPTRRFGRDARSPDTLRKWGFLMRVQQPVRDRSMSLWQSAVRQTLVNDSDLSEDEKKNVECKVSQRAQSRQDAKTSDAQAQTADKKPGVAPSIDTTYASRAAINTIEARDSADNRAATSLFDPIRDLFRRYSVFDLSGWFKCWWFYVKYYVLAHLPPPYIDWKKQTPANLNFGVIDYRLPKNCRVLMIGDWGTHMPDNAALLRQAVRKFRPQAIIHLGDVYYSGTVEECTQNVLDVMDQIFADANLAPRPPFFAIPGNHDYYAGGRGFYHTIEKVNAGIAGRIQPASYFCLRTEDDKWQFLAMDTGYNDRVPTDQLSGDPQGPDLHENEGEWHLDKLNKFSGSTILLSHHQLISAKEQLSRGNRRYLNEKLYKLFNPYFDRISAWYWGHEHSLIMFDDNLKIDANGPALKKGRLLGCSAYEESLDNDPYEEKHTEARFLQGTWRLNKSSFGGDDFYNHAFAIFDVAPEKIIATYYEYPSWGQSGGPQSDPEIGDKPLYQEDLLPR